MYPLLALILGLCVATGIPIGYVFYEAAFSASAWQYVGGGQWIGVAPGPVAGAGVPVVLLALGAYWAMRKMRQSRKQKAM